MRKLTPYLTSAYRVPGTNNTGRVCKCIFEIKFGYVSLNSLETIRGVSLPGTVF